MKAPVKTARVVKAVAATSKLVAKARSAFVALVARTAINVTINVPPVPASRPRVGRFGVYYAPTYAKWMKAAADDLHKATPSPVTGSCLVFVEQIAACPKKTILQHPRGDVDNFVKGPLDAITKCGKFWGDDKQIVGVSAFKRFAEPGETPRTEVHIIPVTEERNT